MTEIAQYALLTLLAALITFTFWAYEKQLDRYRQEISYWRRFTERLLTPPILTTSDLEPDFPFNMLVNQPVVPTDGVVDYPGPIDPGTPADWQSVHPSTRPLHSVPPSFEDIPVPFVPADRLDERAETWTDDKPED